ncbi:MAG: HAD family hydrolase [Acidobacteria bacterium]|nr:HAD family hydrolase [Acidobacteriota bacterium]
MTRALPVLGPRPEAVLFDFGGTLDSDGEPWKERFFRIWSEEAGETPRTRFDPAFYAADDALVGTIPPSFLLSETIALLSRGVAARLGAGAAAAERAGRRFTEETRGTLARRADLLGRLSASYRLGIVSNFYGNLQSVCEEAGIARFFLASIDSVVVGCSKPAPAIFEAALAALDVGAAAAIFVGDSIPRDMAGARGVGMRHVLLRATNGAAPSLCCPGDAEIGRLEDLCGILP